MKRKELIQLVVAVLIFAGAAYLIYMQLAPKKASSSQEQGQKVTRVTPVNPEFSQSGLERISDTTKTRDFYNTPDLNSGLGNTQPFGPLR